MGDGRYAMGYPTDQKHCDRCRKKSFCFYESRYWYKGSLCSACSAEVFEEIGRDNTKSHDYTVNQGPPLDEFCKEPFFFVSIDPRRYRIVGLCIRGKDKT